MDAVDHFLGQWGRERPDVDVSPMAVIGRISRLAVVIQARLDEVFAEHGLQAWEFDVLATLRRSGPPYSLTAGDLDRSMMISSGTTTHRITALERRGFVTRTRRDDDRRVVDVALTSQGHEVFDAAHAAHLDNQRRILSGLNTAQRRSIGDGLRTLAEQLGDGPPVTNREAAAKHRD